MSETITISAEIREGAGKGASRRLRHSGKIPAVLYGGGKEPVALTLVHQEIVETPGELPDLEGAIAKMKELA